MRIYWFSEMWNRPNLGGQFFTGWQICFEVYGDVMLVITCMYGE